MEKCILCSFQCKYLICLQSYFHFCFDLGAIDNSSIKFFLSSYRFISFYCCSFIGADSFFLTGYRFIVHPRTAERSKKWMIWARQRAPSECNLGVRGRGPGAELVEKVSRIKLIGLLENALLMMIASPS